MGDPIASLAAQAREGIDRILGSRLAAPAAPAPAGDGGAERRYARAVLQDIHRIRLNNHLDAYCLQHVLRQGDVRSARHLLTYLYEEFGHDDLLVEDLAGFGYSRTDVDGAEPLFSSELLTAYLKFAIDVDGALPDFVWNWFVEWYSANYSTAMLAEAASELGAQAVQGNIGHAAIDDELDHEVRIESALRELIESADDLAKASRYLSRILVLIGLYMRELDGDPLLPDR